MGEVDMRSIFEYRDYSSLLADATHGGVSGVLPESLKEHGSLVRRAVVEGPATAILFFRDLASAMGLQGECAAHLRMLMLPAEPYRSYRQNR